MRDGESSLAEPLAARRCSTHGIHYPQDSEFMKCPICVVAEFDNPATSWISNAEPDDDWDTQAKHLILEIKTAQQERELIPTVEAEVKVRDGQLWVSRWDVFKKAGSLKESDLFRIGQQVFEVIGGNWHRREYLVRAFSMTLTDEDLARLAGD